MELVLQELQFLNFKFQSIDNKINSLSCDINNLRDINNLKQEELKKIIEARQYYKKAIDIIYERSIQELKDVLNSALSYIFTDRNLYIDVELSDKRGKSLSFVILSNGRKVSLKRGMGMGVKCVISAILQIYYLQCKNSKILMLDEAYSNISKEYIANFFNFLAKLCFKLQFKIILITHDERFINYANKVYEISNGLVNVVKEYDPECLN